MVETIAHYASIFGVILVALMAWPLIKQMLCRHRWSDCIINGRPGEHCSKCGKYKYYRY